MTTEDLNNGRFSCPHADLIPVFPAELVDWWGMPVDRSGNRIVRFKAKHWFVKYKRSPDAQRRDYLAYILGRGWTNVAEVLPLSKSEFKYLQQACLDVPRWATRKNATLVRLVGDYTIDQLRHTDINAAVASELVFSLWIRRRDTHAANRAYISGCPVFFDHGTSLLGEPKLSDICNFFQFGTDAGYAGRWRVELAEADGEISTTEMRRMGREKDLALHLVRDFSRFDDCIEDAAEQLRRQDPKEWYRAARTAGYDRFDASKVTSFLRKNRAALDADVERMRAVIVGH